MARRLPPLDLAALAAIAAGADTAVGDGVPAARAARRARGAYFTPPALARLLAERVLTPLVAPTVLDPAAGDGRLLDAALDVLVAARRPTRARDAVRLRATLVAESLFAIERDAAQARILRRRLPGLRVWTADALLAPPADLPSVDAVLANPPFARAGAVRAHDRAAWARLRGRFAATSHGEWDLSAAFLEACLGWLTPGGRAGCILPSRWLTSRNAVPLRALLAARRAIAEVVDFGDAQLFTGATAYTSVAIVSTAPVTRPQLARSVRGVWHLGALVAPPAGAPWQLASARTWPRGPTLGEVVHIAKGAGTSADRVFLLPAPIVDGELVRATIDGVAIAIELAATRPCLRGRDVDAATAPRAIVPYATDGTPLDAATFARRWPRAAAWLRRHRAALVARDHGAGSPIHYGRPQNLALHLGPTPRVVIPDVVATPRAVLAPGGTLIIDSAYGLYPRGTSPLATPELLLALVRSGVVAAWLDERAAVLRGGYRRMKTAVLAPLPLPAPGPWCARVIAAMRAGDAPRAEREVRRAYGW